MVLYIIISIFVFVCCLFLGIFVLVQNPKGGGLSSTFGGGNQIMGARKTADFLEKATWTLAISLMCLSLISAFVIPRGNGTPDAPQTGITVDDNVAMPTMPQMPAPEQQPTQE